MITYTQANVLGLIQGFSELFPVSSLGHSVILPGLLGWNIDQGSDSFLTFLVATHFATALVLFIFFWKDWMRIIGGFFRSVGRISVANDTDARLAWLLIIGTVPVGIIGILFQNKVQHLLASPFITSLFLVVNGIMLFGAEKLRKNRTVVQNEHGDAVIAKLSWSQSFKVGLAQALALIPGLSRTGSALSGGLVAGLDHQDAARFAFLLATPLIGSAALLKLPHFLLHLHSYPAGAIFAGSIVAAIAAYVAVALIMRYFKVAAKTLKPFAWYCVIAGFACAAFYFFR
jgi:undecaprenyl-diphosphatase